MNHRSAILAILRTVAPNAPVEQLRGDDDLRDRLDLDSLDFLNVLIAVAAQLAVDIPERDYAKVRTLDALIAYIDAARDRPPTGGAGA